MATMQGGSGKVPRSKDDKMFGDGPGHRAMDVADGFLVGGPIGALIGGLLGWLLTEAAKKYLKSK